MTTDALPCIDVFHNLKVLEKFDSADKESNALLIRRGNRFVMISDKTGIFMRIYYLILRLLGFATANTVEVEKLKETTLKTRATVEYQQFRESEGHATKNEIRELFNALKGERKTLAEQKAKISGLATDLEKSKERAELRRKRMLEKRKYAVKSPLRVNYESLIHESREKEAALVAKQEECNALRFSIEQSEIQMHKMKGAFAELKDKSRQLELSRDLYKKAFEQANGSVDVTEYLSKSHEGSLYLQDVKKRVTFKV